MLKGRQIIFFFWYQEAAGERADKSGESEPNQDNMLKDL